MPEIENLLEGELCVYCPTEEFNLQYCCHSHPVTQESFDGRCPVLGEDGLCKEHGILQDEGTHYCPECIEYQCHMYDNLRILEEENPRLTQNILDALESEDPKRVLKAFRTLDEFEL